MEIRLLTDIVKDERGNYYVAVLREGQELTLVNALVERSYRDTLEFDNPFQEKYAEYEHAFLGKIAADLLRHDVVFAEKGLDEGRLFTLEEVTRFFGVTFIDTLAFYRNPRTYKRQAP